MPSKFHLKKLFSVFATSKILSCKTSNFFINFKNEEVKTTFGSLAGKNDIRQKVKSHDVTMM